MVSLEDKKTFLKWFLQHYQLKRKESLWILNYLLNHEEILGNIHFVQQVEQTPKGLSFASVNDEHDAFAYVKFGKRIDSPELAFHDIRMDWYDAFYIELHFPNAYVVMNRYGVLEDNPYVDDIDAEQILPALTQIQQALEKDYLKKELDNALLQNDKAAFYDLIEKLEKLS